MSFSDNIMQHKYLWTEKGEKTWDDIATRVTKNVMRSVGVKLSESLCKDILEAIKQKKFIPGGRYLYASGRPFHQVQNCYEGSTEIVTRFGTKTLRELSGSKTTVMTSGGQWTQAEIRSFGEQELLEVTLIRSGIEKTLYATKEHSWRIQKNRSKTGRPATKINVNTEDLKPGNNLWMVFGYGIKRTPISPDGIKHGIVWGDGNVPNDNWGFNTANVRLCGKKDAELLKFFKDYPKRHIGDDTEISGLPRTYKTPVSLENDRSYLLGWLAGYFAADGCVSKEGTITIASTDESSLKLVKDVCYLLGIGTYSIRYSDRISNLTKSHSRLFSIALMREHLVPEFFLTKNHRERFKNNPAKKFYKTWKVKSVKKTNRTEEVFCALVPDTHEFVLADNILTGNCLLIRAEDSREGWAELLQKVSLALMTGAGVGVVYSDVRAEGKKIRRTGGNSTGPIALMQMINEAGRGIIQGGSRRSALWSGLHWNHPDCHKFITIKNWSKEVRELKSKDFNFPAFLDGTNISVILDDDFFKAYSNDKHPQHSLATSVYWSVVKQMLSTAEPGFSVDCGENHGENLRNACCEVSSRDDSDICNLGSINMANVNSLEEMKKLVEIGTAFLLAGTVYSDVPYSQVDTVRTKNRRLGLGLMGLHEWLLLRKKKYGPDQELEQYMKIYETSGLYARDYANTWDLTVPVKTRAIAPTGSIGILAETTTGIEPIFCVAYKRRYLKHTTWHYEYVIDPTAKRLIESGIDPSLIEDAYSINPERRVQFQAWMQSFVDHAISSTINLPSWGSSDNNDSTVQEFGNMLMSYLPSMRGITCYPDGARGGQPLVPVKYETAMKHTDNVFIEGADICDITKGGSCGD